ncbi:hypothetical protein [Nocardioides euryhalodurans]|uniref:EfeO-type cupredoxin-like domain-containing protein n=1 Tax=Nocardioides euryhalodurans TaxID=2518370 RepID=A0A4P7GNQ2_9ACTN|nr:hypothetical protein [Nocardioides euryhalodurans]QBR93720.1 hypothetical protein EXE57_16650 [Nocardioides euryhalodurans]
MRRAALALTALLTVLATTACGDDPEAEQQSGPESIEITIEDGESSPVQRVDVEAGEEIEIVVKADEPGTLHVHSDPEDELDYTAGTTTLSLSIDQPGVVEVESHELETQVLQLEVR